MKLDSFKKTHTEYLFHIMYCNLISKTSLLRDYLKNEKWKKFFKKLWLYYVEMEFDVYLPCSVRAVELRIYDSFTLWPSTFFHVAQSLAHCLCMVAFNKWMSGYLKIKLSQMPLKPLSASNGIWLGKSSEENELRSKLEESM